MKKLSTLMIVLSAAFFTKVSAQTSSVRVTNNSAAVTQTKGKDVHIDGMGITRKVPMAGGTLYVDGSDCNITVTGMATAMVLTGSGITVNADTVNSIKIEGSDVHVFYRNSTNKNGLAKVSVTGSDSGAKKVR